HRAVHDRRRPGVHRAGHVGGGEEGHHQRIVHSFADVGVEIDPHLILRKWSFAPGRACPNSGRSSHTMVAIFAYPPVTGLSGPSAMGRPSPGTCTAPGAVPSGGMSGRPASRSGGPIN